MYAKWQYLKRKVSNVLRVYPKKLEKQQRQQHKKTQIRKKELKIGAGVPGWFSQVEHVTLDHGVVEFKPHAGHRDYFSKKIFK